MNFLANVFAAIGSLAATVGSQACMFFWIDEPETPKSLIR